MLTFRLADSWHYTKNTRRERPGEGAKKEDERSGTSSVYVRKPGRTNSKMKSVLRALQNSCRCGCVPLHYLHKV